MFEEGLHDCAILVSRFFIPERRDVLSPFKLNTLYGRMILVVPLLEGVNVVNDNMFRNKTVFASIQE